MTKIILSIVCLALGVIAGIQIQRHQNTEATKKAEAACHSWCDKNNPEEVANIICKGQCTGIIVDSECLKFPVPE